MLKKGVYVFAAVLVYGLFLVVLTPAAQALKWVKVPVDIRGINGSLLTGTAAWIDLGDGNALTDVQWRFAPSGILSGRAAFDVDYKIFEGNGSGRVAVDWRQNLHLQDVNYNLNAANLGEALALPMDFAGSIRARVDEVSASQGGLQTITAKMRWEKAQLKTPIVADLGTYLIDVVTTETGQRASITTEGGMLEITGDARVDKNGRYTANLNFRPRNGAPSQLEDYLGLFARKQGGGRYSLQRNGRVQDLAN